VRRIISHYNAKKFKVTNKELKVLKESYYITLAKDKLNVKIFLKQRIYQANGMRINKNIWINT
jgi:hypothetical protein